MTDRQTVRVPLVDISSGGSQVDGQYAYWVSDDGIKARVNLEDPYSGNIDDEKNTFALPWLSSRMLQCIQQQGPKALCQRPRGDFTMEGGHLSSE